MRSRRQCDKNEQNLDRASEEAFVHKLFIMIKSLSTSAKPFNWVEMQVLHLDNEDDNIHLP